MNPDVFISHASEDFAVAMRIVEALEEAGMGCWIAPRNIRVGSDFAEAIDEGVNRCRTMVLVFSAHANESKYVAREVKLASSRKLVVAPIFIDGTKPTGALRVFLATTHFMKASASLTGEELEHLVAQVRAILDGGAGNNGDDDKPPVVAPPEIRGRWRWSIVAALLAVVLIGGAWGWRKFWKDGENPSDTSSPDPSQRKIESTSVVEILGRLKGLPAEPVLRLLYTANPPAIEGAPRPALGAGIVARRGGAGGGFLPIVDGKDIASEADEYILAARAASGGYLYIIQIDSEGKVDWLFPRNPESRFSAGTNPLGSGQTVQVPTQDANKALTLRPDA